MHAGASPGELRFRWAPKLRPEKLRRLYQNDACGILDQPLLDDVGLTLFLRCRDILMVTEGKARCPRCPHLLYFAGRHTTPDEPLACPGCGWETTHHQFHASWRHRELYGGNAVPAFRAFVEGYLSAASAQARLLLIDRLIHAVHLSMRGTVGRKAAENVIEGSKQHVLALLDELAGGTGGR